MWIPKTEDELTTAVRAGAIEEGVTFDAKQELPSRNPELAKDVAAMATDGGVLLYGLGEDEQGRPTVLSPIPLQGVPERISQIVQTSIAEPPRISIHSIPTSADPSLGYIVVVVPPSERAPHMVIVKGDHRYYGRNASGNYILSEGEVARLYERRQRTEVDREAMLAQELARAPFSPNENFAFLYLIARPVFRDERLLEKAVGPGERPQGMLFDLIGKIERESSISSSWHPDFHGQMNWRHTDNGYMTRSDGRESGNPRELADVLEVEVDFDGALHLFCGRAAERESGSLLFFPELVAGVTTRGLLLASELYQKSQYLGMVDIGVALTGLKGSIPHSGRSLLFGSPTQYGRDEYRRTTRTLAATLKDDPMSVAEGLLLPLFNAVSQGSLNPFQRWRR